MSRPHGPSSTSEFEHSSIPATIKKLFKLKSDFLTKRDAWAGTFEDIVGHLTSPRTDCPGMLVKMSFYFLNFWSSDTAYNSYFQLSNKSEFAYKIHRNLEAKSSN